MGLIIRIVLFFLADRRGGRIGIIMTGKKDRVIAEFAKALKAFIHLLRVSSRKIAAAAGADEKRVSGNQIIIDEKALRSGSVARRVNKSNGQIPHL